MRFLKTSVRGAFLALVVTLVAPLLPAGGAWLFQAGEAQADTVSSIIVQGNSRIDADTIRTYVLVSPGKSFGPGDVNDSVKALYDTGLFSNVRIDRRGNALVITVAENPVVSNVRFKGNKKIKTDQLVGLVETKPRSMLSDIRVQSDVERIKSYYAHTGRAGAEVVANKIDKGQGRVEVEFNITEGSRTGIASIEFIGNNRYSDRRLRSVIETRQSNFLSWFTKRDVYSEQKLAADEDLLRRFYMRNGYADFRVLSADVRYDDEKARYYIVVTVDEGPKYKYGDVAIDSSIADIDSDSLRRVLRVRKGQTFNSDEIERTTEDLTIELAQRGYVFAQVRPQGDRNYETGIIDLRFLIDEAARVYIERIDIRGNTKTRDYVIRREFDVAEGDPFNRVLIEKINRRLRGMGLFKNVMITTEPGSAPDRVVLIVTVEEDSTGEFSVAGGYSSTQGFIAEISISEKNFLGRGQYLKLSYGQGISDGSKTYALAFTEPFFMGRRISAGFDLSRTEANSMPERPFDLASTGGGVRLGLPVTENMDLQLNYKVAQNEYSPPSLAHLPTPTDQGLFPGTLLAQTQLAQSVGYVGTFSTIDNRRDPHDGEFFRLNQDFGFNSGPGATPTYVKTVVDARTYHEFVRQSDIVGLLQVQGGNITAVSGQVAPIDNFFKGGETIRGFEPYGIGPRTTDGLAVGGKNFVAATAEVQFPLPMVPDDFGLKGAVFADAGTLFGVDIPAGYLGTIQDGPVLRSAAGLSLLWASPFGLLRLDYAWPITQAPYDQLQPFRFGIGNQF
jgi:outer membrane protein insertion porin family